MPFRIDSEIEACNTAQHNRNYVKLNIILQKQNSLASESVICYQKPWHQSHALDTNQVPTRAAEQKFTMNSSTSALHRSSMKRVCSVETLPWLPTVVLRWQQILLSIIIESDHVCNRIHSYDVQRSMLMLSLSGMLYRYQGPEVDMRAHELQARTKTHCKQSQGNKPRNKSKLQTETRSG